MSRGAEGTASPWKRNKYLSTGLTSYPQVNGQGWSALVLTGQRKTDPRVLSLAPVCIILPNKKCTLK